MSRKATIAPELLREYMRGNVRFMPHRVHDPMAEFLGLREPRYSVLDDFNGHGPGIYPTEFEYVDFSDDDNDDDDEDYDDYEYGSQNNRYCGFQSNFLDRGLPTPMVPNNRDITPEEAAKNAKELLDEEEKLKKKAEKKKQKKMRQRERRRLEKLEKENTDKDINKQVDPGPVKSKVAEKVCEKNKTNNTQVPPDPGQQPCVAAESDDEKEDDIESLVTDLEELDMNSTFVNNAAAIAKRKLEQNPKFDRKDKKAEISKRQETQKKSTPEHHPKSQNGKAEGHVEEMSTDFVTRSMELAVLGNTYAGRGNLETAVKYFTDAIKHNPKEFKLFGNRSFCYEKMQQYDKALIDADSALSLNPTWIKGLYRKGRALVGLKMYYEACQTYKEVLKLDTTCTDAAQELMRVQIMQLMDMGFTREQSSTALIIHGSVEKALEALSGLQSSMAAAPVPSKEQAEDDWICMQKNPPKVPQNQPRTTTRTTSNVELFPIWVGDLVSAISERMIYDLFKTIGPVHSVKVLQARYCAFVNYTSKEDCEKAIQQMHGYPVMGTILVVRYPDKIATHLGVSKTASTDTGKINKVPEECYFWRTTGCIKNNRCTYKHVPEHRGIDLEKTK